MKEHIQIFLAHALEDKKIVRELYLRLKSCGFKPWLDEIDLIPGQNWRDEIPKAIRESDILIACLSNRSVQKQGYIQREFRLALNTYAEKPQGGIFLIPVKFDDCEVPDLQISELGVRFRDIHWVEFWQQNGFERLVEAIKFAVTITDSKFHSSERDNIESSETPPDVKTILPEPFEWCHIPAGNVSILSGWDDNQDEYTRYRVESFYISKYPITYEQFLVFTSSPSGYSNFEWWEGLSYSERIPPEFRERKTGKEKSAPANVERYEAIAFCRWLAYEMMHTITVPSEAHWQRAAQGDDGRKYPWGNSFDPMRCNSGLSGIGRFTPVTKYINGASPYNVLDLSGNAFEWCVLLSAEDDFRSYFSSGNFHPRNSSFRDDDPEHLRCSYRGNPYAPLPNFQACFRLCIPSSIFSIEGVS